MHKNTIQVFEHHTLYYGKKYNGVAFTQNHFEALAKLNMLHENKYFTLLHKGIKFSQYVGVIQVDTLTIEILPKADRGSENTVVWRNVLIEMLRVTRKLKVNQVGQADVNKQNIHLLDIYFDWFLREVEILIRQGLIKRYYKETKNVTALKGKLEFAGHLSKNLIHKERFYTTHQIYDKNHQLHQILNQALLIIEQLTKGTYLYHKCKRVQMAFPEVSSMNCTTSTFEKLKLNRKSRPYEKALEIARLIILNYAPNISSGSERMLALLFDMNSLWEEYVYHMLVRASESPTKIHFQNQEKFWNSKTVKPDIVVENLDGEDYVIDTKWKMINPKSPGDNDLKQMYVYNMYWNVSLSMLLYPFCGYRDSIKGIFHKGKIKKIVDTKEQRINTQCKIASIRVVDDSNNLNMNIGKNILDLLSQSNRHQQ